MTIAEKWEKELKKFKRSADGRIVDKLELNKVLTSIFKECDRKQWIRAEGRTKAIFHFSDHSYLKCWNCEQKGSGITFKTFISKP